jgi:O-antigen/teichoic acid export membrane protein
VGDIGPDALEAVGPEPRDLRTEAAKNFSAQSRSVVFWKAIEYAGLVLFVVLLPRLMQPDLYGRFAALVSVIGLLTMAAAMGAQATFGRFVPEFESTGSSRRTRVLFTQIFMLRLAVALPLAVAFFLAFPHIRTGASTATALWGAGAFLCVALGMVCFQLFYGLNQLGRSLAHDGLIRVVLMALLLLLGGQRDMERAALSLLLAEAAFLALGLAWSRAYFTADAEVRDLGALRDKLTYGFMFFAANLLLMSVWRGGELAVLLFTGRSEEVAYYSVANSVTVAFAALLGQLGSLLVPSLTAFHVGGRSESVESWLGQSLKYLTLAALAFVLLVHALGGWMVHRFLGDAYLPVVESLRILALSLLPVALIRTAMSVAMVRLEGGRALLMTGSGLVAFVVVGAVLVPAAGSSGASIAASAALAVCAAVGAAVSRLGPVMASARYGRLALAGLVSVAGAFLLPGPAPLTGAVAAVTLSVLVLAGGVVSPGEIRRLASAFVS